MHFFATITVLLCFSVDFVIFVLSGKMNEYSTTKIRNIWLLSMLTHYLKSFTSKLLKTANWTAVRFIEPIVLAENLLHCHSFCSKFYLQMLTFYNVRLSSILFRDRLCHPSWIDYWPTRHVTSSKRLACTISNNICVSVIFNRTCTV